MIRYLLNSQVYYLGDWSIPRARLSLARKAALSAAQSFAQFPEEISSMSVAVKPSAFSKEEYHYDKKESELYPQI